MVRNRIRIKSKYAPNSNLRLLSGGPPEDEPPEDEDIAVAALSLSDM